jgi:rod shape-determining protein MreC
MQDIINFIIRNKNFALFLLLFGLSLLFTIQSHTYHTSRFINSANGVTGAIYSWSNGVTSYFDLKYHNKELLEENKKLRLMLVNSGIKTNSKYTDTLSFGKPYRFYTSSVIKNSYSLSNNILTLDVGRNDGIKQDFGVISSKGLVGIIDKTSSHYATVVSILNAMSNISVQLKKTNHFGTLTWNGKSPKYAQFIDIPKVAPVKKGDTIITSGRSSVFPKGVLVGLVEDFKLDPSENYYEINVKLFNDMTNLEHVYIIENVNKKEIDNLLKEEDSDE